MPRPPGEPREQTYRRADRLTHAREFQAAFAGTLKKAQGPLVLFAAPNSAGRPRLGLSVGRRVGNAVTRHRLKRYIREAFRQHKGELPSGHDLVVAIRPHAPRRYAYYERTLLDLAGKIARELDKRAAKARPGTPPTPGAPTNPAPGPP